MNSSHTFSWGYMIYTVMGVDNIAQILALDDSEELDRTRCHASSNDELANVPACCKETCMTLVS